MQNITREIIADLYPLYASGDVSEDSRRLVEEFLSQDPGFAQSLKTNGSGLTIIPAPLPPGHELKTLDKIKRHMSGPMYLFQLSMIMSGFAFARIVSDTSFDVSPRKFIITASIAVCCWIAFFVKLVRGRRAVLLKLH